MIIYIVIIVIGGDFSVKKLLSVLIGLGTTLSLASVPVVSHAQTLSSKGQSTVPHFVCPTNITPFDLSNTPKGFYIFTNQGAMEYSGGKADTGTFTNILSSVQSEVLKNMKTDASNEFNSPNISVSISVLSSKQDKGEQLWGSQLSSFLDGLTGSTSSSEIEIAFGSQKYDIFIPAGMEAFGKHRCPIMKNQQYIGYTANAINQFVYSVQESVLAGSVAASYNAFSIYPSSQVPVSKILKKDPKTGAYTIDGSQSGVKLNYSLANFYNPLFGDMKSSQVKTGTNSQSFLSGEVSKVPLSVSSQGNLKFPVDTQYASFLSGLSSPDNTFTLLNNSEGATGVGTFKTSHANASVKPTNIADGAFQLVAPSTLTVDSSDAGTYKLNASTGVKLVKDSSSFVKLLIPKNYVYTYASSKYTRLGSYADYSIDPSSLIFTTIRVDAKGNLSASGTKEGAILPLWYKEAILKLSSGSSGGTPEPTARLIKFGQYFSGKITLDSNNSSLFSVSDALDGSLSVPLRDYAFPAGSSYQHIKSHKPVGTSPSSFQLSVSFEDKSNMKGFFMFANNYYVDNADLVNWLQSNPAKAKLGTTATNLYNYVTGNITVSKSTLSYSQWQRLQQIRAHLDQGSQSRLQTMIGVTTLVFGVGIIFYSFLMMIAYWIDIFNVLVDFSFLSIMTRGRLYPIASKDALDYINEVKSEVKYVTIKDVLIIMIAGVFVGVLFIEMTPILKLLVFAYFTIRSWVGGV